MLHEFLSGNRDAILALSKRKAGAIAGSKTVLKDLERGLPDFYDRLMAVAGMQLKPQGWIDSKRGELSSGCISRAICGYALIGQAAAEEARERGKAVRTPDWGLFHLSLEAALAQALAGYLPPVPENSDGRSTEKIGALVHELRNALACAIVAHTLVKEGPGGSQAKTNALLERNLHRMRDLIERSFSEIRRRKDLGPDRRPMPAVEAVEEVLIAAGEEAKARGVALSAEVDRRLIVDVDRHDLVCALLNLVQNAIKFSKRGGRVWIRGSDAGRTAVLEVEDRCGGLPEGKVEELFRPFTQKSSDKTGLGLGLSICRKAMEHNDGALSVRDIPGIGCVFSLTLPKTAQSALAH